MPALLSLSLLAVFNRLVSSCASFCNSIVRRVNLFILRLPAYFSFICPCLSPSHSLLLLPVCLISISLCVYFVLSVLLCRFLTARIYLSYSTCIFPLILTFFPFAVYTYVYAHRLDGRVQISISALLIVDLTIAQCTPV